jgi:hypothetical protein
LRPESTTPISAAVSSHRTEERLSAHSRAIIGGSLKPPTQSNTFREATAGTALYELTKLTAADEARIGSLVKKAAG